MKKSKGTMSRKRRVIFICLVALVVALFVLINIPLVECSPCDGQGLVQVFNADDMPEFEPSLIKIECWVCKGNGKVPWLNSDETVVEKVTEPL